MLKSLVDYKIEDVLRSNTPIQTQTKKVDMTAQKMDISFAMVEKKHQALVLEWLSKPHVQEWFHGDGLANTINGLDRFVNKQPHWSQQWIAYCDGEPFAYVITSALTVEDAQAADLSHLSKWVEPGKTMSSLDLLIGEEKYLGKGLAKRLIIEFIETILSDSDIVFIDPEKANTKAVHVYQKAGFEPVDEFIASWHPVPHLLMRLKR